MTEPNRAQIDAAVRELHEQVVPKSNTAQHHIFYVVSERKFWWLMGCTFGMYSIYWFYRHWRAVRDSKQAEVMPFPRALFFIFFTHGLFGTIDARCEAAGVDTKSWDHAADAWWVVALSIVSSIVGNVAEKLDDSAILTLASIVMFAAIGIWLCRAQRYANAACGDPSGAQNDRLSVTNKCWIGAGLAFLAIVLIGVLGDSGS